MNGNQTEVDLVGDRGPNYDTSECKANEKGKVVSANVMRFVRTNEYFVFVVDDDGVYLPSTYINVIIWFKEK